MKHVSLLFLLACVAFVSAKIHIEIDITSTDDKSMKRASDEKDPDCTSPKEAGYCRARKLRWYFDTTTKSCQEFFYGGCKVNGNNYKTKEECEDKCIVPDCTSPKEAGNCRASFLRWYYDTTTKTCQEFVYGGCDGNGNNYETKKQCDDKCMGRDDDMKRWLGTIMKALKL